MLTQVYKLDCKRHFGETTTKQWKSTKQKEMDLEKPHMDLEKLRKTTYGLRKTTRKRMR